MSCGFCGGPARVMTCMGEWTPDGYAPSRWTVVCAGLYAEPIRDCPGRNVADDRAEAIAAWNRRPTPSTASPDREEIVATLKPLANMGDASIAKAIRSALRPHEVASFDAAVASARSLLAKLKVRSEAAGKLARTLNCVPRGHVAAFGSDAIDGLDELTAALAALQQKDRT